LEVHHRPDTVAEQRNKFLLTGDRSGEHHLTNAHLEGTVHDWYRKRRWIKHVIVGTEYLHLRFLGASRAPRSGNLFPT